MPILILSFDSEFWKQVPPSEPYRVILGDVRDKLYQTRERSRHLLAHGISDIPEEATYTNVEQVNANCCHRPICYSFFNHNLLIWFLWFFSSWNLSNCATDRYVLVGTGQ